MLLIAAATDLEADALRPAAADREDVKVLVTGLGRTNAAAAVTEAICRAASPVKLVINAGVAGALPRPDADPLEFTLALGEVVAASSCVYVEEGLRTPEGFRDVASLGFPLGDFPGNAVPIDASLLDALRDEWRPVPIATVATCSGTDELAREVARRTGAPAEAMEGAAVVHAARRLGVPALEVRAISNTTGDRSAQRWDLRGALAALPPALAAVLDRVG